MTPDGPPAGRPGGGLRDTPPGGRRSVEITTLRRDVATDGRARDVAFTMIGGRTRHGGDFTINAMFDDARRHGA